jgi:Tol biopolymer transport system component
MHKTLLLWLSALAAAILVPTALAGASATPGNGELAFTVQFDTYQLFSVRPDFSKPVRLTTDLAVNYEPVASPDGRRIAYARGLEGRSDIFVMNRDGSEVVNVTHHAGDDYDPMWSPDSRRIAFTSHRTGDDETYVMNADGTSVRRVTHSRGDDENPTWMPDGRRLVVSSVRGGDRRPEIYVVTISTGRAVRLTNDTYFNDWPQVSPNGRWIAYTRDKRAYRSGDIVVMRSDGRGAKAIRRGPADDWYPTWSPDSRRLVYVHNYTLYVVDRDGRHDRRLEPEVVGGEPYWARDGTVYYDDYDDENPEIAVARADGGGFRLLTEAPDDEDVEASWSPDGTRLLYQSDRTGDAEIWLMQADGGGKRNLTQAPRADDRFPAWSPDGAKIAFTSDRGGAHNDDEIVVMNSDGTAQTSVSGSPSDDYEPTWSPDGRRIAFARTSGETADIWTMDADGRNQVRLTTNTAWDDEPSWSPDGSKILFASTRTGLSAVWEMNTDGSDQHLLVRSGEIDGEPSWSPDGRQIVFDRWTKQGIDVIVADADGSNEHLVGPGCVGKCRNVYPPDPSWQPLR